MRMRYILEESRDGFRRARGSCLLSVLTVAFFLALLGFLSLISANISYFKQLLNEQLQMQAFISNALDEREIAALSERMKRLPGITKVQFTSREDAARDFQREFGVELFSVLDENPLPASFTLHLKAQYQNAHDLEQIAGQIRGQPGIEEVVYHFKTWITVQRYARLAGTISWILLLFVTVGSLFVVSNNIRLVITAREHIIATMRLVGATSAFIRIPLLLEGTLQGLAGGGLSAALLYMLFGYLGASLPGMLVIPAHTLWLLLLLGGVLGLMGSALAIKKHL